ncbi:unnamed protein product [Porites evermanni]|uniref:Uncharacterized protein n=1 Tax=Porites evermanni TaxID=104178 RepID=A0ABN8SMU9_9CNID|nr:unnamed protein product [Porites evermanni]
MEDLQLDFSGLSCDGGLSIDANLELNLGGDTGGIALGQIQFPNRQARQILFGTSQARPNLDGVVLAQPGVQLLGTSQARPNLGGVVLAQPGPGVPLQGNSQALPNFGGVVLAQSGVPLHTAPPTDCTVIKQCLTFVLCFVAIMIARLPSSTASVPCPTCHPSATSLQWCSNYNYYTKWATCATSDSHA